MRRIRGLRRPVFIESSTTQPIKRPQDGLGGKSQRIADGRARRRTAAIPAHWLRIAALAVNVGLWALIIWGVRLLLRL